MNFIEAVKELKDNPLAVAIKVKALNMITDGAVVYIKNLDNILRVCYTPNSEYADSNTFNFYITDYLRNDFTVIYKEVPKELTVAQIEEKLGYKIKVISDKEQ